MPVGIIKLTLYLPGCHSLKEKRRLVRPIITHLQRQFNLSAAENDHHDVWQTCQLMIACAVGPGNKVEKTFEQVIRCIETRWPDLSITKHETEIIY